MAGSAVAVAGPRTTVARPPIVSAPLAPEQRRARTVVDVVDIGSELDEVGAIVDADGVGEGSVPAAPRSGGGVDGVPSPTDDGEGVPSAWSTAVVDAQPASNTADASARLNRRQRRARVLIMGWRCC